MDTFSALAEPTRRSIIELLAKQGQLPASDIYKKFQMTHAAVSQHLKVLREANLVHVEKKAQQRLYNINTKPFLEMDGWIKEMTNMWEMRFDALEKALEIEKKKLKK